MTQDNPSDDLSPSLGGDAAHRTTNYEPSLSLDRLLPGLRDALGSDDRGQRLETIEQIIEGGSERVVPMLIELLQDVDNAKSRQRIVAMLGQLSDARAVGALVDLLNDVDAGLRKVVVWALGQIGSAEAVEPLLALVERESDPRVAGAAILSLGKIGDLKALPALLRISEDTSNGPLVDTASTAIKLMGQGCSLVHLIEILCGGNEALCQWAAEQFIHHTEPPCPEHIPMLEKLLFGQVPTRVRRRSMYLLAAMENEQARDIVLQSLIDPDENIRLVAYQAVKDHQIQEACDILLSRYAEETDRNCWAVVEAIGVMDNPRVVPFLLDLVETGDRPWAITELLQSRDDVDVPQLLLERLHRATGEARFYILSVLGGVNTSEVVAVLLGIAQNSADEAERCKAIASICLDEYPEATSSLIDILHQDPSVSVQNAAIRTLRGNLDEQAEAVLRVFLAEAGNDELRATALNALLGNEIPDAVVLLLEQIDRIKDEEALATIAHRFDLLQDEINFPIVERLYRTAQTESLRSAIMEGVSVSDGIDTVVSLVIDALRHDHSANVRFSAVQTLGSFFEYDLEDSMGYPLENPDSEQRMMAALIEALNDTGRYDCDECEEGHRICDTVAGHLRYIGSPEATAAVEAWQTTQESDTEVEED